MCCSVMGTIRDLSSRLVQSSSRAASYDVRLSPLSIATAVFGMSVGGDRILSPNFFQPGDDFHLLLGVSFLNGPDALPVSRGSWSRAFAHLQRKSDIRCLVLQLIRQELCRQPRDNREKFGAGFLVVHLALLETHFFFLFSSKSNEGGIERSLSSCRGRQMVEFSNTFKQLNAINL
jgi:hypothetical protein